MELDKFLNLIASIFGTLGAIYVMIGILAMTPELIKRQSNSYWDFSIPQIESLCQQKADNVSGFVFVILAFVLVWITIVFVPEGIRVFESKGLAFALSVVLAGCLYMTLNFVSNGIYKHQKLAVGKIITGQYLESVFEKGQLLPSDNKSLQAHAIELLDLKVSANEPIDTLLGRTAKVVGIKVPATLDYSAVKPMK